VQLWSPGSSLRDECGRLSDAEPELLEEERRIPHAGALARVAGACARRPWRVVGGWLAILVLLIGLNAAFHGKLINDFKISGSDTQKATGLITSKFGAEKGAALRVVVAAPPGQRLDTAMRGAAIRRMLVAGKASHEFSVGRHLQCPPISGLYWLCSVRG
jgi:hypothetical protein